MKNYIENIKFAGVPIYNPKSSSEVKVRIEAERNLRSKYQQGKYSDPDVINSILQHQFTFYNEKLEKLISKIASRHFMEFILFQFDQASNIENIFKQGNLSPSETDNWKEIGPVFRRTAKFLAEQIVLLQPDEAPRASKDLLSEMLDEIWIAAKEMVELYLLSDQTIMIFPDNTTLEIYPEGNLNYWNLNCKTNNFIQDVSRDTSNRNTFIGPEISSPLFNFDKHDQFIGNALKNNIGATYKEAVSVLRMVIDDCQPLPDGFPVLFIHWSNLVNNIYQLTGLPAKTIENILNGFTMTKTAMESEGRKIWKPKQEYRALRRAFFEMSHCSGKHIAFSKTMAIESWIQLTGNVAFKKFPKEWQSQSVNSGLDALSNYTGTWFEKTVEENLKEIGFIGLGSIKKSIGKKQDIIYIPDDVGEIDFLGYSEGEKVLIVAECKMVQTSFESKFYRDDLSKFVTSKKSYLKKFRRKVEWVIKNRDAVINSLNSLNIYSTSIKECSVVTAIITFFPNISKYFIEEYPCISLTNLMLDYYEAGKWPYSIGTY